MPGGHAEKVGAGGPDLVSPVAGYAAGSIHITNETGSRGGLVIRTVLVGWPCLVSFEAVLEPLYCRSHVISGLLHFCLHVVYLRREVVV